MLPIANDESNHWRNLVQILLNSNRAKHVRCQVATSYSKTIKIREWVGKSGKNIRLKIRLNLVDFIVCMYVFVVPLWISVEETYSHFFSVCPRGSMVRCFSFSTLNCGKRKLGNRILQQVKSTHSILVCYLRRFL